MPIEQLSMKFMRIFHSVITKLYSFCATCEKPRGFQSLKLSIVSSLKCQITVLALKADKTKVLRSRDGHYKILLATAQNLSKDNFLRKQS